MLGRLMPREGNSSTSSMRTPSASSRAAANSGAIVGVGTAQNVSAVRWGIAGDLLWAWVLTIPCSAFMAALAWALGRALLA